MMLIPGLTPQHRTSDDWYRYRLIADGREHGSIEVLRGTSADKEEAIVTSKAGQLALHHRRVVIVIESNSNVIGLVHIRPLPPILRDLEPEVHARLVADVSNMICMMIRLNRSITKVLPGGTSLWTSARRGA